MTSHSYLLSSFNEYPSSRLSIQDQDEHIILLLRAHPITQIGWIFGALLALFLPLLLFVPALQQYIPGINRQIFIIIFWYGFVLSYVVSKFFFWYFNIGVITNKRIVDLDNYNLLNAQTTATIISKIEEIDNRGRGILTSFFDYGNVFIQTAGTDPNLEFMNVPRPSEVVTIINNLMKRR